MKRTGWKERRKRLLALGISAVMIGNLADLSVLPVFAMEPGAAVESVETEQAESGGTGANSAGETFDMTDHSTGMKDTSAAGKDGTEADGTSGAKNDSTGVNGASDPKADSTGADESSGTTDDSTESDNVSDEKSNTTEIGEDAALEDGSAETIKDAEASEELTEEDPALALFSEEEEVAVQLGDVIDIASEDLPANDSGYVVVDAQNVEQWNGKTLTGSTVVSNVDDKGRGLLVSGVDLTLTIRDLTIDRHLYYSTLSGIALSNGASLHLIQEGTNTIYGSNTGILVPGGTTLTIAAESTGTLYATGGARYGGGAGIGASSSGVDFNYSTNATTKSCGTILIKGGTVHAQGGTYIWRGEKMTGGAGIGGTYGASGGKIEITGGTVDAKGGFLSAGIGGGWSSSVDSVLISGGTVTASAGDVNVKKAAAIGTGVDTSMDSSVVLPCGTITITGGTVTANGNIGYGDVNTGYYPTTNAKITVSGGTVDVVDGTISDLPENSIDQNCILRHYDLKLTIHDASLPDGTVTGTVALGDGENAWRSENTVFTVENGTASAAVHVDAKLYGKQSIVVTLDQQTYGDKTIDLDTEAEAIWGAVSGLRVTSATGAYRYENGVLTFSGSGSATVTMADGVSSTEDSIQIADNGNLTLTLENVSIDSTAKDRPAIAIGTAASTASSKCTLILVGENTLVRNAQGKAVVDALGKSILEITGSGKAVITNNKTGFYSPRVYSAGIQAMEGKLIFSGNPTVEVTVGANSAAIQGTDITVNGGNIRGVAGREGHGIGYVMINGDDKTQGKVTINGGTVYAEGGRRNVNAGGIATSSTQMIITGGNVHMNRDYDPGNETPSLHKKQPQNANGTALWCTTITVGSGSTVSKNARVYMLNIKDGNETTYPYNTDGMYTDGDGKLYLWLPENAVVTKVVTANGTYAGTCTTNTELTNKCAGNEWGTASAKFTLQGTMFIPVTDITLIGIPDTVGSSYDLNSIAEVLPANATNKEQIRWELDGQMLDNGTLQIHEPGRYQLTAIVQNGAAGGEDFRKTFTLQIKKSISIEALSMSGWTYGEQPHQPAFSISEAPELESTAKIEYSTAEAGDYTTEVPTSAGTYWVQVTIPATDSTVESVSRKTFTISPKSVQADDIQVMCAEQYFTGKAITPESWAVRVFDGETQLGEGEYEVKADGYGNNIQVSSADSKAYLTIQGTGNYTGTRQVPFAIVYLPVYDAATVSTEAWTSQPVTISAPDGYLICLKKDSYDYDDDFKQSVVYDEPSTDPAGTEVSYFLKDAATGAVSAEKTITVKIDRTKPVFTGGSNGMFVGQTDIRLNGTKAFENPVYSNANEITGNLRASDAPSGVTGYGYHVETMADADRNDYVVKNASELEALAAQDSGYWTTSASGSFALDAEGSYVVYAYAEDAAGNRSDYICSKGITIDRTAPVVSLTAPADHVENTSVTYELTVNEPGTYAYLVLEASAAAPTAAQIKASGAKKSGTIGETDVDKVQQISWENLTPDTAYCLYACAEDRSGNESSVVKETFTTQKSVPTVTAAPTLSGVYGTAVEQLTLDASAAKVDYENTTVTGSWRITDSRKTDIPQVGTQEAYELTFTPDEHIYAAVTASVTPQIEKAVPQIGTVTADTLTDTLVISEDLLKRSDTSLPGALVLTDAALQYGTHSYSWKFTPTDTNNYEELTGTVSITAKDTIPPTVSYQIGTDGWKDFGNTADFETFRTEAQTMEIVGSDKAADGQEDGSGIAQIQYFISDQEITDPADAITEWTDYTDKIRLDGVGTYFIYVKAADEVGNTVVQNSEGVVIYAESALDAATLTCTYQGQKDLTVHISLNGNTFAAFTDSNGKAIAADAYTIDTQGALTLKAAYLAALEPGTYIYQIQLHPQGIQTDRVTMVHSLTLTVEEPKTPDPEQPNPGDNTSGGNSSGSSTSDGTNSGGSGSNGANSGDSSSNGSSSGGSSSGSSSSGGTASTGSTSKTSGNAKSSKNNSSTGKTAGTKTDSENLTSVSGETDEEAQDVADAENAETADAAGNEGENSKDGQNGENGQAGTENGLEESATDTVSEKTSGNSLWIFLLILVVIAVGAGIFFLLWKKRKEDEEE